MSTSIPQDLDAEFEGIRITALTFSISLFAKEAGSEHGEALLDIFGRYRELVGDEALRFYATGTMSKHKPVTKRALSMLDTWTKPGAKRSDLMAIEYHDGAEYNHAPTRLFALHSCEEYKGQRLDNATLVRLSLPYQWAVDDPERMVELTTELWGKLPFRCGHAGFALECTRYLPEHSHEYAYAKSMRHPGVDIPETVNDSMMVGFEHIRGIGWLTMLDDEFVEKLGGADALVEALGDEAVILPGRGVMLRADEAPRCGDVNHKDDLPGYRAVYAAVQSLMTDVGDAPSLNIGGDFEARMETWLTRFAAP